MSPLPSWLRRGSEERRPTEPRLGGDAGSARGGRGADLGPPVSVAPAKAGTSGDANQALVFQAAALVLTYPEAELLTRLDTIDAALSGTEAEPSFAPLLGHLRRRTLSQLQSFHIQEFDLSRRHALHLSYWTDGDTRRRGEVLAEIKGVYRESGLLVDTGGELPDYLPMVLEFAVADPERGVALLQRFRASVELLRLGLAKDGLPHAGVLEAVCACLPGESPQTHAEVQARYGEARPVEFVGLDSVESLLQRRPSNGQPDAIGGQPGIGHEAGGRPASASRHPREGGDLVTSSRGGS